MISWMRREGGSLNMLDLYRQTRKTTNGQKKSTDIVSLTITQMKDDFTTIVVIPVIKF